MLRLALIVGLARASVALQAVLFLSSLLIAPVVHNRICQDVCALTHAAHDSGPPCHAHEKGSGGGCQCLGDCCSIHACATAPETVADLAPPSPLPAAAPLTGPERAPRAPDAWLLPYPTGPPSAT